MIKEGKIGVQEAIALITTSISVKVYFTAPAFVAKVLGPSSWYMTLISAGTAMLGFTIVCKLLKRFPGRDLIDIFEQSMGRFFGFIASMILALFLLANTAAILREFAEVLKVYVLQLTPPSFVIAMFLSVTVAACFLGFESIARAAKLFGYLILGGFLLVVILAANNYDYHNLFPFLGYGLDRVFVYGVSRSSYYGEVIALGIIASTMQGLSHIKKAGYIALMISGFIATTTLLSTMMAFNYTTAQEMTSRMYELSRLIRIGGFLQRLDPLFVFTWCIGSLISISFLFYCTISTYCKAFRIQDMRPVIVPFAIIFLTAGMIPQDLATVMGYSQIFRQHGWTIFFGLPSLSLIIAIIRKKKGAGKSA
ncbi:MAG: endospore germination permease [Clostridia bacterium]|nr:endospore germination permease [Clostridia bacterium]